MKNNNQHPNEQEIQASLDKLLNKFKEDPQYELKAELGKMIMRPLESLSQAERIRYDELNKILMGTPVLKKVGITVDTYKLERFKSKLAETGITDLKIIDGPVKKTSFITMEVPVERIMFINDVCMECELYFHRIKKAN